jgi:hypothetical protein
MPTHHTTEHAFIVPVGTKNSRPHSLTGDTQTSGGTMRLLFKKAGIAALAALSLVGATLAASSSAEARYYGRGWGGGWAGPAIVGGLALGALAASRPYYYGGYGGYGGYGYYGDGCIRNRVVGYTPYGRPIVRPVNVCY